MSTLFVLLDETNGATTTNGESLTPDKLVQAAELLTVYMNGYVGLYWGIPGGCLVRAGAGPTDIQAYEWPFHLRPTVPEPGAVAFHTVDGAGVPDLWDALTLSGSIFGADSALSAWAHELAEALVDPGTNAVYLDATGTADATKGYAAEVCDPVETQSFMITTTTGAAGMVSNFVLPPYFIPNHAGPFDYMTAAGLQAAAYGPPRPLMVAPGLGGNYQIVFTQIGGVTQVMAHGNPSRRAIRKMHPSSRPYRRGLRLGSAP